jgi:hypothetical protein
MAYLKKTFEIYIVLLEDRLKKRIRCFRQAVAIRVCTHTDKKENKIFLIYREIQSGVLQSHI